jgi:hypothetical protein
MTTPSSRPTPPQPPERDVPFPSIISPESNPPTPWQRWKNFWFPKSDPTTLAFIRICTGILVLYVHLAYSLDLQAFFGKHGWYASSFIERERQEGPSYITPFFESWDNPFAMAQLSEYPLRRQAFMDFLRGLPADAGEREMALKYLNRINAYQNPDDFIKGMMYIQIMTTQPEGLQNYLKVLTGGKLEKDSQTEAYLQNTPLFFRDLPLEERRALATEAGAFWTFLGKINWSDLDGRKYVLNYFYEVGPLLRRALVEYINKPPEDPTERKKLLDFMEYWNSDPRKANHLGHGIFSVWFHITDPTQMALVHTGILIAIALFTIGLFTRITSILVWVAAVGYIHRTQQVLFGMDTMMNILLFYLMIGNSGAALSVDRLISRYRAARASLRRSGTIDANTRAFLAYPPPSANAGFGLRLIQIHFCFIYMAAGLSKLKGAAWWNGQAFWDVIANPEFTLMPYAWYEKTLRWISSVKPIYYTMTISACWLTLFVEIATPFLLWTRLRWLVILLAAAMHAVIGVLMGLNLFELMMIVMLIAFFPDRVIRDRFRGGVDLVRLVLTFNPQNQRHAQAAALSLATDIDNQITLNADKNAAVVTVTAGPDGKQATGQSGLVSLFRNGRLLSVLGCVLWIPGMKSLLAKRLLPSTETATIGSGFKPPSTPASR